MKYLIENIHYKKAIIIFFLLLYFTNVYSQEKSKYFIEFNAAKTTVVKPIWSYETKMKISFINGIRIGRKFENDSELTVSILKESSINKDEGIAIGKNATHRYQLGLGYTICIIKSSNLNISLGGELLLNRNKYNGYTASDTDILFYAIDDITTYEFGAAAGIQAHYYLNSQFEIGISIRAGIYDRKKYDDYDLFFDDGSYLFFEPISALSLRTNI